MQQVLICESLDSGNPYLAELLSDIADAKEMRRKVYSMYIENTKKDQQVRAFWFETTSKDIFLRLGALPITGPDNLAQFLEFEFQKRHCKELMFSTEEGAGKAVLAVRTVSEDGEEVSFYLS